MKGPMLVSGLISILIKTLLPMLLEVWRRSAMTEARGGTLAEEKDPGRCCCGCRRNSWALAPFNFLLRAALLIFQADKGAVGGCHFLPSWPPGLAKEQPQELEQGRSPLCGSD